MSIELSRNTLLKAIVDTVIPEIVDTVGDNLLSVFIVGSMARDEYVMRDNNDLDLRIILREMTATAYQSIWEAIKNVALGLWTPDMQIVLSDVIGPVRYSSCEKRVTFLHFIVLTELALNTLPSLHRFSYSQNYELLWGMDYLDSFKSIRYSTKDICNSNEGIFYCIDMLRKKVLRYQQWRFDNYNVEMLSCEEDMDEITYIETVRYSLLKALNNCRNWMNWHGYEIQENDTMGVFAGLSLHVDSELYCALLTIIHREYNKQYYGKEIETDYSGLISLLNDMATSILRLEENLKRCSER